MKKNAIHTKIMDNRLSHFICRIWLDVTAIALVPFRIILISKRFKEKDRWLQNAIIRHELIHMNQADKDGTIRMMFKYIFSKKRRLQYEVEAYVENVMAYVDNNYPFNAVVEYYAKTLSSKTYLWMTDKETAEKELRKAFAVRIQEKS